MSKQQVEPIAVLHGQRRSRTTRRRRGWLIAVAAAALVMASSGILLAGAPFDADGYYVPIDGDLAEGFGIEYLAIQLVKAVPPRVYLGLRGPSGQVERQACRHHSVNPDGLLVRCPDLRVGDVELVGTFRDKIGQYWNRLDELRGTAVLTATVSLKTKQGQTTQRKVQFTYSGGD